jgi:hypothetical protein
VEVLQVIRAVTKIPQAGWRLISSAGLLSWLQGIISKLPPPPTSLDTPCDLSMSIVMLMKDIWLSISSEKQVFSSDSIFFPQIKTIQFLPHELTN